MRLSRSDLFPVLTIVTGGVIGASLLFGLRGSPSGDEAEQMTADARAEILAQLQAKMAESHEELRRLLEEPRPVPSATVESAPVRPVLVYIDGVPIVCKSGDGDAYVLRSVDPDPERVLRSRNGSYGNEPFFCIVGVGAETANLDNLSELDSWDIKMVEGLKADAAVRLFGERASHGAMLITLKEDAKGRP